MAQYGKLSGTVTDAEGNPISGATVEVRRQGAFVTSTQAGPVYTVNDPGGVVSGDQVRPNALSGPSRNVSAVTATTITTSGPGLGTLNNNDRISVFSTLPTLYADASGAETKSNPLTTDASGYWHCWVEIRPYDIIETYGSTVRLKTDLVPEGQEYVLSNIFSGAGIIAWLRATIRTLTAGYLFDYQNPVGVTKIRGDYAGNMDITGNFSAAGNVSAVNGTFSGDISVTDDITADDITCDDLTVADVINAGTFTYSGTTGNFSLTAGSIETADLAANATTQTSISTGTTDQTFAFGSGFTAVVGDGPGSVVAVTVTPASTASEFEITAYVPCQSAGAAASHLFARIRHSGVTLHEAGTVTSAGAADPGNVSLMARQTGLSGAQTWSLECDANVADMSVLSSSTSRKAKLMVKEFKK